MSHVEKNLLAGESVVYRTRPHWIVCFKPALVVFVLCVMSGVAVKITSEDFPLK